MRSGDSCRFLPAILLVNGFDFCCFEELWEDSRIKRTIGGVKRGRAIPQLGLNGYIINTIKSTGGLGFHFGNFFKNFSSIGIRKR